MVIMCTLCGGGQVHWQYLSSFYKEMYEQPECGMTLLPGIHTDIGKGRNTLATVALSDERCTHIMWMDADQAWNPGIVKRLLSHDRDIVGAAVRKRKIEVEWCHAPKENGRRDGDLLEVDHIGTGALMIRRQVYEKMASEIPEIDVNVDKFYLTVRPEFQPSYRKFHRAYHSSMVTDRMDLVSDDVSFCERAKRCGFDLWVDLGWPVYHFGEMPFYSDPKESLDAIQFRRRP